MTVGASNQHGEVPPGRIAARPGMRRLPWPALASLTAAAVAIVTLAALAATASPPAALPGPVVVPGLAGPSASGTAAGGEPAEIEVVRPRPSVAVAELPPESAARTATSAVGSGSDSPSHDGATGGADDLRPPTARAGHDGEGTSSTPGSTTTTTEKEGSAGGSTSTTEAGDGGGTSSTPGSTTTTTEKEGSAGGSTSTTEAGDGGGTSSTPDG